MSIYRTAIWMTVVIMGSKLIGFVREILFANYFGATYISDAYFMATAIPSIIVGGVFSTVAVSYMPIYSKVHEKEGSYGAELFTNSLINISFICATIIAFLGMFFSREIVSILARGFIGDTYYLTVYFVKISFFTIITSALTGIFASYLQYHNRFILQTIIGYSFNLVLIIAIVISDFHSHYFLVCGLLIAQFVQLALMVFSAYKNNYRYKFLIDTKNSNIRKLLLISFPIFIGNFAGQINAFIDKMLASRLPEGSIAALNYGNQINIVVYGLLTMAVTTIIYPLFSKQAAANDIQILQKSVIKSFNFIIIVLLPVSVGLILLRNPIIEIIYQRGVFDETAKQMTSTTLLFFSIGMIGLGVRDVLSKAFFSLSDTKTPMINGIICMIINVVLNLLLIEKMGIAGLALSTSIASIVSGIILYTSFYKKYQSDECKKILITLVKASIAVMIMCLCVYFLNNLGENLSLNIVLNIIKVGGITVIGAMVYYGLLVLLNVEEIKYIKSLFKKNKQIE